MITHLIIMTTYGQIYFSHEFVGEQDIDVALTGGLISAIYSMTAETQREKISEMDLELNKIIFREMGESLLFILTVDKRMDEKDASGLLDTLAERFEARYEGQQIEGMILSDFEPDVLEITKNQIWYADAPEKPQRTDWVGMVWISACIWFYSWLMSDFGEIVTDNLVDSAGEGSGAFLIALLLAGSLVLVPGAIAALLTRYSPYIRASYRFVAEFLRRPTRASYVELFPRVTITPILFVVVAGAAWSYNFGVFYHEFGFDPLIEAYKTSQGGYIPTARSFPFDWKESYFFDAAGMGTLAFIVMIFGLPAILRLLLAEKGLYWRAVLIVSISTHVFLLALMLGSSEFLLILGFSPGSTDFRDEQNSLRYLFVNVLPLNVAFWTSLLFMGIGLSRLPKGRGQRMPFALAFAIALLGMQVHHKLMQYELDSVMWPT